MIAGIIRLAGLTTTLGMLAVPDPAPLALWGVVVTTIGSVVAQIVNARSVRLREEQRHRFETEDREATMRFRLETAAALTQTSNTVNAAAVQINDGIHRVETKAEVAYETANHVSARTARIAKTALADRQVVEDRNVSLIRQDLRDLFAGKQPGENRPPEETPEG